MCYNFKDKVIVIFGANTEIGNYLCDELVTAGADVICIDNKEQTNNDTDLILDIMNDNYVATHDMLYNNIIYKYSNLFGIVNILTETEKPSICIKLLDGLFSSNKVSIVNVINENNLTNASRLIKSFHTNKTNNIGLCNNKNIANSLMFLLSEESDGINGHTLIVK